MLNYIQKIIIELLLLSLKINKLEEIMQWLIIRYNRKFEIGYCPKYSLNLLVRRDINVHNFGCKLNYIKK